MDAALKNPDVRSLEMRPEGGARKECVKASCYLSLVPTAMAYFTASPSLVHFIECFSVCVLRFPGSKSLRCYLKCRFLNPILDLMNQNIWVKVLGTGILKYFPGYSLVH